MVARLLCRNFSFSYKRVDHIMNKRKVPVEVAGYRNVLRFVIDDVKNTRSYRWHSVANDDASPDDFLPWEGDSDVDDCPF